MTEDIPNPKPAVTVGVVNFGRPEGLRRCLESLLRQSFRDFEIIVSDDASPDPEVRRVIEEFAARDPRVRPQLHPANIGMFRNFRFALDAARAPLFLWSSNDDHWSEDFLAATVAAMEPGIGVVSGGVVHFNDERVSERVFDLGRFACTAPDAELIGRFVAEPEILGKSHLIYALFRTDMLRAGARATGFGEHDRWSEDIVVAASVLMRAGHASRPEAILYKHRRGRKLDFLPARFAADHAFPFRAFRAYRAGLASAAATPEQREIVERVMTRRLVYKLLVSSWRKPLMRLVGKRRG